MTKNPFLNAIIGTLYITIVVLIISRMENLGGREDLIFMPIAMISLFTLSAAVMGYVFLSQPLQLYLSGSKSEALALFLKTIGSFALITLIIFAAIFFGR